MTRRSFQRLSEDARRNDLLEATLAVIADCGINAASARRIAERAGVSAGLIRHYFASKEEMLHAAYAHLIGQLISTAAEQADLGGTDADARLAGFVEANLSAPNLSDFKLSLWATFIGMIRSDAAYAAIHRDGYREFLEMLQVMIAPVRAAHDLSATPADCRRLAIALNGLIDGLWLEGSLEHGLYDPRELAAIGLRAAEDILRLPQDTLLRHRAGQ